MNATAESSWAEGERRSHTRGGEGGQNRQLNGIGYAGNN